VLVKTQSWQVDYLSQADAILASMPTSGNTVDVLINFGVNDFASGLGAVSQSTWQANLVTLIQKARTRYPNANEYVMYPWNPGHDADAATLHTWIDNAIATANTAAGVAYVHPGPDENIWLRCAGCLEDGAHYSHLGSAGPGNMAAVAAWLDELVP
jgi:lysophospholipase L1-like esterase